MLTGPHVILALQVAVGAVTVLLLASLVALALGRQRLHGRINMVFFTLTVIAVLGLELVVRVISPEVHDEIYGDEARRHIMSIHLCFSVPSTFMMPLMLWTGLTHRRKAHLSLAAIFAIAWTGTFVTGIFFLK